MQAAIAIVVVAFDRTICLNRILDSIKKANYDNYQDINLFISIDYSGNEDCLDVANNFNWQYGTKNIINHRENLGLKKHIISCGDLVENYDAVIVLEDDLFVATGFYDYAQQAYSFYKNDYNVAGIGLYNYKYNELIDCPFDPIVDNYDNYFLQVPCSWGQMWTKQQWKNFKNFAVIEQLEEQDEDLFLPNSVWGWPKKTSWKRIFYKYMVKNNKHFVYPRISLTTNFGDVGQHYTASVLVLQTPLLQGLKLFTFSSFQQSYCIYDSFFEFDTQGYNRITNQNFDTSFDLNGSKPLHKIKTKYLVSAKECLKPIKKFQVSMYPYECNIIDNILIQDTDKSIFTLSETINFSDEINFERVHFDLKRMVNNLNKLGASFREEVYSSTIYRLGLKIIPIYNFINKIKQKTIKR